MVKLLTILTTLAITIDMINNISIFRCLGLREKYSCEVNRLTYNYFEFNFYIISFLCVLTTFFFLLNIHKSTKSANKTGVIFYILFMLSYFANHNLIQGII